MRLSTSSWSAAAAALLSVALASAAETKDVKVLPSIPGLKIEQTTAVECSRKTVPGDKLSVAYRGVLTDGTEFDSSIGGPPITFTLGMHQVIKGWDMGLIGMCIGESRKLTIAPELAYGNRQMEDIPPGSTLIFDTKLEAIEGVKSEQEKGHDVTVGANGLKIDVTTAVECERKTKNGDRVSVEYRGTLTDGTEFDKSVGGPPFQFVLGKHQVIEGWDLGLLDMCIGEARLLTIPSPLAYGDSPIEGIPPGSTLIFETKLISIAGVENDGKAATGAAAAQGHKGGPKGEEPNNGECRLLGPFAILIQGALGALALLALVWKRYRERPRRPIKVWFFDVSKQIVGSAMLHVANLLLSMLFSGDFDVKHAMATADADGNQPNPCSFYLLNLAIDTTIGIPILVLLLRVLHMLFSYTPLANPPESLKSGHYGRPPHASWWLKQSIIYFIGLFGMKFCVFVLFQLLPWLGWIGDWALRWTEGNEALQITFVMLVFPLVMNGLQYWIIDSFIKDRADGWQDGESEGADGDEDDEHRGLMAGGDDVGRDSHDGEQSGLLARGKTGVDSEVKALKSANPTPVPAYSSGSASGSSSFGSKKLDTEDEEEEGLKDR